MFNMWSLEKFVYALIDSAVMKDEKPIPLLARCGKSISVKICVYIQIHLRFNRSSLFNK